MYNYEGKVISVYDGDTITMEIDLGLHVTITEKIRLARINAPEIRGKQRVLGLESKSHLISLILNKEVKIRTIKDRKGKYGRYLGEISLNGVSINDKMVKDGKAVYKKY